MNRRCCVASLVVLVGLCLPAFAAPPALDGNWKVGYSASPALETVNWLIKIETKDGKLVASILSFNERMQDSTVESFVVEDNRVRLVIKTFSGSNVFEGQLGKDGNKILGVYGDERRPLFGTLTKTDATELTKKDYSVRLDVPEPMQQATTLMNQPQLLRFRAGQTKDANERQELLKKAKEAEEESNAKVPGLLKEVVEKHPKTLAAYQAATLMLRGAAKSKASKENVDQWAKVLIESAEPYGPRWKKEATMQASEILLLQEGFTNVGLAYAEQAEKQLEKGDSNAHRVRVLKALAYAQKKMGQNDQAAKNDAAREEIDLLLDKEYHAKVPPFKPQKFGGRKGDGNRVVVMELFTGAQCPPCVAADVAFDALLKTYQETHVVFLQYHLHIPGPDPMTNPQSEDRFQYYRKDSPKEMGGTPSVVFNGKPLGGGGGPMDFAQKKYQQYRDVIDDLVEGKAGAKIEGEIKRSDNKISIAVKVDGITNPGEDKRLRLVLVEDTIRYVGSNGLRIHHEVVRGFPGGVEGFALNEKSTKHNARIDLDRLRTDLTTYLDDSHEKRPFPYLDRPLDFKRLKLVAFVQDDKSKEILQGAVIEIPQK